MVLLKGQSIKPKLSSDRCLDVETWTVLGFASITDTVRGGLVDRLNLIFMYM